MAPLSLIISDAGRDALVDAENGDTDPIVIAEIGLSEAAVVAAPTLELLNGEFKRIDTFAGQSISPTVIHMTAQDVSDDAYELRSIALYLADGTLFAAYGQDDPIFTKVSIAVFLVAFDVAFNADVAASIEFGDASFLYPPATETIKGVAELATQAETDAGADDQRTVTPLKLKVRLDAALAALSATLTAAIDAVEAAATAAIDALSTATTNALNTLAARTITGGGLATGGGDLSANRTITVAAASLAETDAGAIGDKAVVPSALANILANIAALLARTITGGGLVTGGGDLSANRTLTVTAASGAEIATGTENGKAVTPAAIAGVPQSASQHIGLGGAIVKMGTVSTAASATTPVTFPVGFPTACDQVLCTPLGDEDNGDEPDETWWRSAMSSTGFSISRQGDGPTISFAWVAWGR